MTDEGWFATPDVEEPHPALQSMAGAARRACTPCGDGMLAWRAWGQGEPIVLLHGGSGSWRHWLRNIGHLAADRMVICPDLPGLGDSALPPAGASPESIAPILREGLQWVLPRDAAYDLVGFSFGALCAGHLAALDREACRSLTIVGAGALGFPRSPTELVQVRHLHGTAREEANRHNLAELMFADPARIDELALRIQDLHTRQARFKSRRWANTDSLKRALQRVRVPLAGIYGEQDAIARPHVQLRLDLLREIQPTARTAAIPGAGHWVAYEAADAFNAILAGFVARDRPAE